MSRNPKALAQALGQIDTPTFKAWFGDSKAVDEQGVPQVMYHGTASNDIRSFNLGWRGVAGHFAYKPEFASQYAKEGHSDAKSDGFDEGDYGATVYPVYLKAVNVFDSRKPEHRRLVGIDGDCGDWEVLEQSLDRIKAAGFDSYYDFEVDAKGDPDGIAVFSPAQIKSAIGNFGTFCPDNPDIRCSSTPRERAR